MALCGISLNPSLEPVKRGFPSLNSSTRRVRHNSVRLTRSANSNSIWRQRCNQVRCFSGNNVSSMEFERNAQSSRSVTPENEELGPVSQFKMSDFMIFDHVSVGIGGRADEVVFEAIVKDMNRLVSHFLYSLYNRRVVLRQLTSIHAKRRGRRALEVLKKLAGRRVMYHSYSMQVHGYVSLPTLDDQGSFTLVHGYHGSSLRHWLQLSDWLPTLEATLALDEEYVRKVGDDTVGGPATSRQLRLIRILMRELLIAVNYLHSHGLAHTELRLENVHISPVDRHIKVGILGNAADFYEDTSHSSTMDSNSGRRKMMIAFDIRCVGFMMAKMVLRELMDPLIFAEFKLFLTKGNDPSCLREFLLQALCKNSPSGNPGLQILDRNWGAGWNLLSLLLATKPSGRISCLDALRHPFLCGPRWRVELSMDVIRWGLGSTAVRITEEYIYNRKQRSRLAHFIELMEMLNPHPRLKNWLELLPGKWRLLYSTGRHIGLTLRQPSARVLIGDVNLTVKPASKRNTFSFNSNISFTVLLGRNWPLDKAGVTGQLHTYSPFRLTSGKRFYLKEDKSTRLPFATPSTVDSVLQTLSGGRLGKAIPFKEFPSSLPVVKLLSSNVEVTLNLDDPSIGNVDFAGNVVQEIRTQVPPEMFDVSKLVCGTYVDSRLLVLRGVNGSALLFTRSRLQLDESCR
ncbi:Plastid lipid-associated protein/fibrillin conserved domain [Dillenia turbinata]|uniref:Plastid lipid-associated protein/fibrillin conserved domain n=1 Tax=Dillenia turbinata TaxID=194707 RepID=A0AAN8Z876_9MAGN